MLTFVYLALNFNSFGFIIGNKNACEKKNTRTIILRKCAKKYNFKIIEITGLVNFTTKRVFYVFQYVFCYLQILFGRSDLAGPYF